MGSIKVSEIQVVKRDGREVPFDRGCIYNAVLKAYSEACPANDYNEDDAEDLTDRIITTIEYHANKESKKVWGVEDIQDYVKDDLMFYGSSDVALAYIEYAATRKALRDSEMDLTARIKRLVDGDKDLTNENANKDSRTFSTKRDLMAGQVAKSEGLRMLPKRVRDAHLRGDIHYHDLDYNPFTAFTNCCLVDIKHMLASGFNMGNAVIGSPKSIQTAVAQTCQIVANVASSQYGGTSLNRIDEVLEPYAMMNYEKHLDDAETFNVPNREYYAVEKTKKDIYDACQSMEYEINTLYTSNGQTPFTTLGLGLSTSWIGREIQKAILNVRLNGLGVDRKTAIFPY